MRSRSLPERPTNGSPARSSSRPGPSPTNSTSASGLPTPNTTWVRPSASGHLVQVEVVTRSRSRATASLTGIVGTVDQDARHAWPDTANHLVADRAQQVRPVVRRDRLVAPAADQDDLVAGPHRVVGTAIDHDLVHRHHAGQRAAHTADQHVVVPAEEGPRDAVGAATGGGG